MSARTTTSANPVAAKPRTLTHLQTSLLQRKCECGGSASFENECEDCKKKKLQRRATRPGPVKAPSLVHDVLRSPGRPLDMEARSFFEPRFGHDFSKVRVHTDERAAKSARAVNAVAYTAGHSIVFENGQYNPSTRSGRKLLAHELAHVVQQGGVEAAEYRVLPEDSREEREAEDASHRVVGGQRSPMLRSILPSLIGRVTKQPGDAGAAESPSGKGASPSGTPPASAKPQRLRFDILGADAALADFLAKAAGISRDPDLRVTSLEDMIVQLENKAPAASPSCIEHINIFNHGMPGYQAVTGEGDKKVATDATQPPSKLRHSGFSLGWLYSPANQAQVARLRNVFCCGAEMYWLGCGTAGVKAEGGTRSEKELKESDHRYGHDFGDRYRDEADAKAHGATLQGATFGKVAVQSWADATCTTIRAATDFVQWDTKNPDKLYRVGYGGEFLDIRPSTAGGCACDPATGHVRGNWDPSKGIERGDAEWRMDLDTYNQAVKAGPNSAETRNALLELLKDVAPSLTIPAGLPLGPTPEPWVQMVQEPNWIARTVDNLALCFPNNAWKWLAVNPSIIQETPAYTRITLNHELQHASDMQDAAKQYQTRSGPPPTPPPEACTIDYQPTEDKGFGTYALAFRASYRGSLRLGRHLEIYATSAAPDFQRLSPGEKVAWFSSMLTEVPPNVPAADPLPTEALVNGVFENPLAYEETMRTQFADELFKVTRFFIYGIDGHGKGKSIAKATTLVTHFNAVWKIHPGDRGIMIQAIRVEGAN